MKIKSKILLVVTFALLVSSCTNKAEDSSGYDNLTPEEFRNLISSENVFLLDVHIPEQQHIKDTDAFIPFNELGSNLEMLPEDKSTPIAIYCRSGSMSAEASEELSRRGYKNVYNLLGGTNAWKEKSYEFEVK